MLFGSGIVASQLATTYQNSAAANINLKHYPLRLLYPPPQYLFIPRPQPSTTILLKSSPSTNLSANLSANPSANPFHHQHPLQPPLPIHPPNHPPKCRTPPSPRAASSTNTNICSPTPPTASPPVPSPKTTSSSGKRSSRVQRERPLREGFSLRN